MDRPQVFVDFHHSSLLKSFILLFERRFGGKVFRPIGMTWHERGFWNVYDHPETAEQFLGMDQLYIPPDGTPPLNRIEQTMNDFYTCKDVEGNENETNKAITFEQFLTKQIDIVIATLPQHVVPYRRLIQEYKPNAKLIVQLGNRWGPSHQHNERNILDSTRMPEHTGLNYQFYHQEFDTNIFCPQNWVKLGIGFDHPGIKTPEKAIYSFMNVLQSTEEFDLFRSVEQQMRVNMWDFKSYGGQCRDGCITGNKALAEKMRQARFIWHLKHGDGYGHIIHNAAAVGRPLIINRKWYQGSTAEALLIDGETCIDVDGLGIQQILEKINYYSDEKQYRLMCQKVYANFKKVVDFDKEADEIRGFLDRLV